MVQARQIYVYAHAALLGWFPEGKPLAEAAMRSLLRDFPDGSIASDGFAFSINGDGAVVSPARDAYAHAFILFALAWLHRLNGDPQLILRADETIAFIDAKLIDPIHGGLYDSAPVVDRIKRQNPHMHLLEAYLALEAAAPGRGYLERAKSLVEMFKARFFRAEPGVLLEYFAEDWSDHPDPLKRRVFEPGHHFEWVWLLREFEKFSGEDLGFWIDRLAVSAQANGFCGRGLIFDEVASDMKVVKDSHRIWPHAEGAKAAVALQDGGDESAPRLASTTIRALLDHFLDRPFEGGWIDHIGADGRPLVDYAPASSLYHLFLAGTEAARCFPPEDKAKHDLSRIS